MGERQQRSGPQFRADRPIEQGPAEQETVRTTIVGGRPPGSGQPLGDIPRGVEILVKKASVDPQFRTLLLDKRADAAKEIGLSLDPSEVMMLSAVPAEQLEIIIGRTTVPQAHRRAFLGKAAAMLAAVGLAVPGCDSQPAPAGIRPKDEENKRLKRPITAGEGGAAPDEPDPPQDGQGAEDTSGERPEQIPVTDGIRPTEVPAPQGIRPDQIPASKGIRPDRLPAPTGSAPDLPPGAAPPGGEAP